MHSLPYPHVRWIKKTSSNSLRCESSPPWPSTSGSKAIGSNFRLRPQPFPENLRRRHKSTEFQPTFHYLFPSSSRPYRGQHEDHDVNITRAREQAILFSTKKKVFCPSCISEDKWLPWAIFFKVKIRRSKTLKIKIKTLEDMNEPVKGIFKIYFLPDRFRKRLFLIQDFVDNK